MCLLPCLLSLNLERFCGGGRLSFPSLLYFSTSSLVASSSCSTYSMESNRTPSSGSEKLAVKTGQIVKYTLPLRTALLSKSPPLYWTTDLIKSYIHTHENGIHIQKTKYSSKGGYLEITRVYLALPTFHFKNGVFRYIFSFLFSLQF